MNKHFLLFLLTSILNLTSIFGQNKFIQIFGNVKDISEKRNLENIWVDFHANDTVLFRTKTDSLGNYKIIISKTAFSKNSWLNFCQDVPAYKKKYITDSSCINSYFDKQYLCDRIYVARSEIDSLTNISKDILLKNIMFELHFPTFLFAQNSIDLIPNPDEQEFVNPVDALNAIKCILKNISGLVIRVNGHCDYDESDKFNLSVKRTQSIIDKLVSLGINPKRLSGVGFSDKKPKISTGQIRKRKNRQEKQILHGLNRRVTFTIIAYDFE